MYIFAHAHTIIIKHTVCSFQIQNKCKWYACYTAKIYMYKMYQLTNMNRCPAVETVPNDGHSMSISQKVVSLRSVVSVNFNQSKDWKSHLRLILDLRLFVKSTPGVTNKSSHFVSAFFWNHMMILYCENVCMI
jgi:hypothetical protein